MNRRIFLQMAAVGTAGFALAPTPARARPADFLPYDKLTGKADLIVIATPVMQTDVGQQLLLMNAEVIGVETVFHVTAVLKDTRTAAQKQAAIQQLKETKQPENAFVLFHYRLTDTRPMINGPMLATFDPKSRAQYILFLQQGENGRFIPVTSQYDADFSIEKLRFPAD